MKQQSFGNQIHDNAVAIISLIIAIVALVLNTWRLEQTERNRNTRQAGFEIIKTLGELQAVVNTSLYIENSSSTDPILGWTYISMMSDLVSLMPDPVPEDLQKLIKAWGDNWKKIAHDEKSADLVSREIDITREAVLKALNELH